MEDDGIFWRILYMYKRQSSANTCKGDLMLVVISFMYNRGPRTVPCRAPDVTATELDVTHQEGLAECSLRAML